MAVLIGVGIEPAQQEPTEHWFYNSTICLRFYPTEHIYRLVRSQEEIEQDGTTTVVHIIDKSNALIPWGVKVASEKFLRLAGEYRTLDGAMYHFASDDLEKLVTSSKSAHREKLDEAADVGKRAHDWIERWIRGDSLTEHEDPRVSSCCRAALWWINRHNVRFIRTEHKVYSRKYGYAGTMDGLALCDSCPDRTCCPDEFKDVLSLVDWKSSNQLNIEYLFQTAAYVRAYMEEFNCRIEHRWVNRLGKEDDAFEPWHLTEVDQDRDFEAFLTCLELTRTMYDARERMAEVKERKKAEERRVKKKRKRPEKR